MGPFVHRVKTIGRTVDLVTICENEVNAFQLEVVQIFFKESYRAFVDLNNENFLS